MQGLQILIDQIEKGQKLHISVLDLCGILNTPLTSVSFKNAIHSKPFCSMAKSTPRGYRVCRRCKALANRRALLLKAPFCGMCLYGMYEAAVPVVLENNVAAIVYVGNAILNENETRTRLKQTCRFSKVSESKLAEQLDHCERIADVTKLYQIGELVADYLKTLCDLAPKSKTDTHWFVSLMKSYADEMLCTDITLQELAQIYRKNPKYMGRLFKQETGVSFNEYCIDLRLKKAGKMLLNTEEKIIDIAMECGFDNISYFNRSFKKKFSLSPGQYRAANQTLH